MNKIRVMIVEDSRAVRELLQHLVAADPRLEVVAAVASAEEALRVLDTAAPDVISMDIRLPGMNGFEATVAIMTRRPTPIVVVSASVEDETLKISMNALRAGALSVVEKPVGTGHQDYAAVAERLCNQFAIMSQVKVIRQRIDRGLNFGKAEGFSKAEGGRRKAEPIADSSSALRRPPSAFQMLGVVASTGGPPALTQLLGSLPADFPVPIVVVQHITPCFLDGFVSWLGEVIRRPVKLAADGEVARPGTAYLPPADTHLEVRGTRLYWNREEPVGHQRPAGTVLFRSMARSLGPAALGVLLTGMGEDGAEGLRDIRAAGGYTIAEDESTAVVYGMPAAAVRMRAVCESLPLPEIGPRVRELVAAKGAI